VRSQFLGFGLGHLCPATFELSDFVVVELRGFRTRNGFQIVQSPAEATVEAQSPNEERQRNDPSLPFLPSHLVYLQIGLVDSAA